jgi:hypothetical protein
MPTVLQRRRETNCFAHEGATEISDPELHHALMAAQLDHRSKDELIKDSDSDFPEPGFSPEHS